MQNKTNPIIVVLLVIAIILLGYIAFKSKIDTVPSVVSDPIPSSSEADSNSMWITYSNNKLGFSFQYPSTWKINTSENSVTVTSDSSTNLGINNQNPIPLEQVTFTSTDKSFFNVPINTKFGQITYDVNQNALVDSGESPARCLQATPLINIPDGFKGIMGVHFGGSLMSDPAYSDFAILTNNGPIIIIASQSERGTDDDQNNLVQDQIIKVYSSLSLLNGNTVFVPACAAQN